jgi:hypothetical protein
MEVRMNLASAICAIPVMALSCAIPVNPPTLPRGLSMRSLFLAIALLCLSVSVQAQTLLNEHGLTMATMNGNEVHGSSGSTILQFNDDAVQDNRGTTVFHLNGDDVSDGSGVTVLQFSGDFVYHKGQTIFHWSGNALLNGHGHKVAQNDGIGKHKAVIIAYYILY